MAGSPADALLPAAAAWGGYPGGLEVVKGGPLFPRIQPD
jgi:methionyl-tRNA synthetase